jgi:transposase
MRRYALRDDQWNRIKDILPGRKETVGVTAKDNRLFVEAVLYRYRAGVAWRDLPERFGDFRVVHLRHMRWSKTGVLQKMFELLSKDADNEYAMIDSTIVRTLIRDYPTTQWFFKNPLTSRHPEPAGGGREDPGPICAKLKIHF